MNGTVIVEEHEVPSRSNAMSKILRLGTRVAHEQHGWGTIVGHHPNPEVENDGELFLYIVLLDQGLKHRKKERALVLDRASFKLLR